MVLSKHLYRHTAYNRCAPACIQKWEGPQVLHLCWQLEQKQACLGRITIKTQFSFLFPACHAPLCISTFHCSPTPEEPAIHTERGSDDFQTLVLKLGRNDDLRAKLSCNGLPAACAGVCGSFFAEGSTGFSQKSSHILITPFTHPSTRYPSQPSRQVSF